VADSPVRLIIGSRDVNLGGALASAAEARGLEVSALVGSIGRLLRSADDAAVDAAVTIDPSAFPPEDIGELAARVPLLMIGPGEDQQCMVAAVEAGAMGYADIGSSLEELVDAIESVAAGVAVIPPHMLGTLLRRVVERRRGRQAALRRLEVLSPREREIFELAARGNDKDGLAALLFISPATARTHIQNVFKKLEVHSMAELVALAAECGLDVGVASYGPPDE
jgi:DNA-binding NarL/FixJ family response regulator